MPDADAGRLSPDGRWRWDGTEWKPTIEASAPAPLPAWAGVKLRGEATWPMLLATVVVGVLADQWLRTGTFGLAATLSLVVAALALILVVRPRTRSAVILALAAVAFAAWLTVRASPWLLWPDLATAALFLGLSASFTFR